MGLWKTTLDANSRHIAQVSIKCSIYQGETLSPLLFCIGLNALSKIITKSGLRYQLRNGAMISHLIYMDEIKCMQTVSETLTRWATSTGSTAMTSPCHSSLRWSQLKESKTRRQHSRCSGQIQIPWDPAGKRETMGKKWAAEQNKNRVINTYALLSSDTLLV